MPAVKRKKAATKKAANKAAPSKLSRTMGFAGRMGGMLWARKGVRVATVSGAALLAGIVFVQSGAPEKMGENFARWSDQTTVAMGLGVEEVTVTGRIRTPKTMLIDALGVDYGSPILRFDPDHARAALEQLPWVVNAYVVRRLPGHIHIALEERLPYALWQSGNEIKLVDHTGTIIEGADLQGFGHLPLVVGEGANTHAAEAVRLMRSEMDIAPLVSAAMRVGDRRWTIRLENGIDVALPEENADTAWAHFAEMVREQGILDRQISFVDLRIPGRPTVRLAPDSEEDGAAGSWKPFNARFTRMSGEDT